MGGVQTGPGCPFPRELAAGEGRLWGKTRAGVLSGDHTATRWAIQWGVGPAAPERCAQDSATSPAEHSRHCRAERLREGGRALSILPTCWLTVNEGEKQHCPPPGSRGVSADSVSALRLSSGGHSVKRKSTAPVLRELSAWGSLSR